MSQTGRAPRRRGAGELESDVLAALWAHGEPATLGELVTGLGYDLASNTVQTILTRLSRKGVVTRRRSGHGYLYTPATAPAQLRADKMRAEMESRPDHGAILQRFVTGLTAEDAEALRAFLASGEADDGQAAG